MTLRSFRGCSAALILAILAGLALPELAEARQEALRWTHPAPSEVQGFEAFVRAPDGSGSQVVSISTTAPSSDGIYYGSVEVGDGDKIISLRAISSASGEPSAWSTPPQLREGDEEPASSATPVGAGIPLTPTPGAERRFDFTGESTGDAVGWWIDSGANFSRQTDDSLFGLVSLGSNLVLHTDSTADNIHSHLMGTVHTWSDYEVRGRMAVDDDDAAIGVTTYSQYLGNDGYYRLGRPAGGAFTLEARPGNLSCSTPTATVNPIPGRWYRFKLDVQDMGTSNQIRAKVWREDNAEPSGYTLNCVDSSAQRPSEGRIGAWSAGAGQKYWDDFEVILGDGGGGSGGGGGGTTAPPAPPVLIQIVPAAP